jgi:phage baseplate assembly protein W
MEINKDIIGIGWSFPPTFIKGGDTGDLVLTDGKEDIDNSLHILLNTAFGERVMRPEYGCDLRRFLFDPVNANMQAYLKKIVEEAILYFEPRIRPEDVAVDATNISEGKLEINVIYTIKSTNSRSNYVYPFYIKEATLL